MIKSLLINNYALIQSLEMFPSAKLNIITGETGAGKSIMLGAIGLLLGKRADTKTLYNEGEKCLVEGTFDLTTYKLKDFFTENELDYDDECIIRREISPTGKSRGFINDTPVTLDVMRNLGEYLMDIHSQHESLELGNNQYQQRILDLYSGNESLLNEYQIVFKKYLSEKTAYSVLVSKEKSNSAELDFKRYILKELEEAQLINGEQEELEQELEVLENAEEIKSNLSQLVLLLDEGDFSSLNQIKEGVTILSSIKKYRKSLQSFFERTQTISIELQDLAKEMSREQETIEFDPERIQLVKGRLDMIYRLQQKHQVLNIASLLALQHQTCEELDSVSNLTEQIEKAKKALEKLESEVLKSGDTLSKSRQQHAPALGKSIEKIIHKLGIENGQIQITINPTPPHINGADQVEMLFSANKGIAPKELKQVASGGEFSRLIFAVKYLIADKTSLPTIIFDEIDTGVSGEVALQMITMMKEMSQNHQVISISHLPQFAAGGDAHYYVYKDHSSSKSESKIRKLNDDERILEIAKMIGGNQPGQHAVQSAKELLGL
jgi:DNA repair protein RecN (Recombination protein N)